MSDDLPNTRIDFQRPIPLFPLPNCVLFPGAIQPLHIFEPRYRELMADTLRDQSLIAMTLLRPGWEKDYYGSPAIHEILCVGKIISHEKLDDGKYNLLLHGLTRARIITPQKHSLYRTAILHPIPDAPPPTPATTPQAALMRRTLCDLLSRSALKELTVTSSLGALFDAALPVARLIDVLAFTLVQDIPTKQRLLEELEPIQRGEMLLKSLLALAATLEPQQTAVASADASWPPPLSTN